MNRVLKSIGIVIGAVAVIATITTSCNMGSKYPKETAALDSLAREVHKSDSMLNKVDTVTIKKDCDHIMIALGLVKMAHKDTMSEGAATIFRNINQVRWEMEVFMGKKASIQGEIAKAEHQLSTLSHDLKNGNIKADSVQFYYSFEVKRASELSEAVRMALSNINGQFPLYNMMVPQADSLVSRIKNHQSL
jgi:hypothetical protein